MSTNFIELVTDVNINHTIKLLEKSGLIKLIYDAHKLKIWCLYPKECNDFKLNNVNSFNNKFNAKIELNQNNLAKPKDSKSQKLSLTTKIICKSIFKNKLEYLILKILGLIRAKYASIRHSSKYKTLIVVSFNNYAIYSVPAIHTKTILITYKNNKDINVNRYNTVKFINLLKDEQF